MSSSDDNNMRISISVKQNRGDRNYMEDVSDVIRETEPENQVYLGVYDGHGGKEAAHFAKDHLWDNIKSQETFNSGNPIDIKRAITDGFLLTHKMMFDAHVRWPKRKGTQNSTAGTTATIAIIKDGYLYIGHVGDSGAVLGQSVGTGEGEDVVKSKFLTKFHKPDSRKERKRIEELGGSVVLSKGISRVVWKRPLPSDQQLLPSNQLPVSSVPAQPVFESVPFLAVARSLGDCWSHVPGRNDFLVSPRPDVIIKKLEPAIHRFLLLATDGLWEVFKHREAGALVSNFRQNPENEHIDNDVCHSLILEALKRYKAKGSRADNITAIVIEFNGTNSYEETDTENVPTDIETEETPPIVRNTPVQTDSSMPPLVRSFAFRCETEEEERMYREHGIVPSSSSRASLKRTSSEQLNTMMLPTKSPKIVTPTDVVEHSRGISIVPTISPETFPFDESESSDTIPGTSSNNATHPAELPNN